MSETKDNEVDLKEISSWRVGNFVFLLFIIGILIEHLIHVIPKVIFEALLRRQQALLVPLANNNIFNKDKNHISRTKVTNFH